MSTLPEDISSSDRIGATNPIGQDQKKMGLPNQSFQSMMKEPSASPLSKAGSVPSPFDLSQQGQMILPGKPTMDTLLAQIKTAQGSMGDLSNQLSRPNLKLKQSAKYLLKNKLTDATTQLRTANSRLGGEDIPPSEADPNAGPLARFLAILSDGQNQLASAQNQLQTMKTDGKSLQPGELLLLQVKLNKAQQEIEYASVLLSKAVEDMKQLFNVQL